jgi:hypothetical protein
MSTNDDDVVYHNEGVSIVRISVVAVISCFILMRVTNLTFTSSIFNRKSFPSNYQWYSVILLHTFSLSTGIFTLSFVTVNLVCLLMGDCPQISLQFFYICYALQALNVRTPCLCRLIFKPSFCFTNCFFFFNF